MSRNPLRDCLNAGKPTVGTHILSAWPTLVELIGHSKQYDYVEFTAEYAPFTMHDLDNLGRAFELMNMSGMIKIEQTQYTHQAMRAIGATRHDADAIRLTGAPLVDTSSGVERGPGIKDVDKIAAFCKAARQS